MSGEALAICNPPLQVELVSGPPPEWRQVTLRDVIALEYGRSLPDKSRQPGSVPVYGSNGVVGWHDEALVPSGGIIIGRKGTAGSVTVSPDPFWPIDTTYFVKARQNLDWDWLAATLHHARLNELNEATGVPGLNRDKAYLQPILLPPLDEQRRIAEVLRSVDEAIAANETLLDGVRSVKQGTMEEVLSGGFTEVRLETLLAETRYPMRSGPFGSALLKSELHPEGVPFLGIDNVHVERFVPVYRRFVSEEKYRELSRYTVYPGDVMVTIMGTVGRCCVVPPNVGTAISSKHVWTLTIDQSRYSPAWLAWQINHSRPVLEQLRGSAQGGIMSAISSGTLRDLMVPLPSPTEVREIEDLLLSFNAQIAVLEAERDQANTLKAALMSDLLSGRVRVPA
ncbi:restriction endonuclease subunit S [Sphingomonas canadensis]|uniref:Restriction endonuclease subunit S n=1 Tax=Sphingomonas canadensis TaxID=1219257 RepID=A0ABW3H702_9SPHN|nr:restriction endonuclease subunit S [Sphingomonas canadensis]MCW3837075.1 restriction endonuclease subunit S [Sphingomonas canadensis]